MPSIDPKPLNDRLAAIHQSLLDAQAVDGKDRDVKVEQARSEVEQLQQHVTLVGELAS